MVIHLTKAGEGKIRDRGLRSAWPFNFAAFSVAACLSLAVNLKRFCWQGKRKSEGKVGRSGAKREKGASPAGNLWKRFIMFAYNSVSK